MASLQSEMLSPLAVLCLLPLLTQALLMKSSKCNQSLGCIINPESTIMLTWQPAEYDVHFTLRGYIGTGDLYVAMGLSDDQTMGEDDITECVNIKGQIQVFSSYNIGKSNLRNTNQGLSNQSGIYDSGTVQCSFTRSVQGSGVNGGQQHDLDREWHVMLVWGELFPGTDRKQQHTYRSVSSFKVSLRAVGSFETQKVSDALIHLHGCLMLIAWVAVTSIGVIVARHYKGLLPESQLFGKDIWFQVHRSLMVAVLIITAVGFVVIFVEVGGYREVTSSTDFFALLHPILGIIVTALTFLNPILALFRPNPTSPRRPIFNWVHRCIGTGCHVIAVLAIFFGLRLKKVAAPLSMFFVLGGFAVWHLTVEIILCCVVCFRKYRSSDDKRRESTRSCAVQEKKKEGTDNSPPRPSKVSVLQEVLLMMHSAVAVATTIFLLSLLLSKSHSH